MQFRQFVFRSFVVSSIYCERGNLRLGELHEKWNSIGYWNFVLQRELALQLTRSADIIIPEEGCKICKIERFQLSITGSCRESTEIEYTILAAEKIAIMVYSISVLLVAARICYTMAARRLSRT